MDAEGNRREEGTVVWTKQMCLDTLRQIRQDIPRSNSGNSGSLFFNKSYLHSAKDFGIKEGDKVSYYYQSARGFLGGSLEAIDIRVIDNG